MVLSNYALASLSFLIAFFSITYAAASYRLWRINKNSAPPMIVAASGEVYRFSMDGDAVRQIKNPHWSVSRSFFTIFLLAVAHTIILSNYTSYTRALFSFIIAIVSIACAAANGLVPELRAAYREERVDVETLEDKVGLPLQVNTLGFFAIFLIAVGQVIVIFML